MKISPIIIGSLGALTLIECTYAHPGMATTVREIEQRVKRTVRPGFRRLSTLARRQDPVGVANPTDIQTPETPNPNDPNVEPPEGEDDPPVLIGDIKDGGSTPVGKSIARILLEQESGQSDETYTIPGALASAKCKADTCCVWAYVAADLTKLFRGPSGRCNEIARTAIRLGFHDAGTWKEGLDFGGADGSIMLAREEIGRADNKGLQNIVSILRVMQLKYKPFGVGAADLIQFAAKHAVVTCPLGPRIRTFVGRKDSSRPSQNGLLPAVTDSADSMIALFRAKTISPHSLVALLGAHTTSTQNTVDPRRPNAPQDGTPGVWDTLFYNQTLGLGPLPKVVLRFQSDVVLAKDPRTAGEWERFSMGSDAQHHWNEDYAYSYIRVSILGVGNVNNLTECTKVLPAAKKGFQGAGELLKSE